MPEAEVVGVRTEAMGKRPRRAQDAMASYRTGSWAWLLHRITGLLILVYLYFHLIALSSAAWVGGMAAFNRTVASLTTPTFIVPDLALFALIFYPALNGIRIICLDLGWWVGQQRMVFWIMMAMAAIFWVSAAIAMLPLAFR